MLDWSRMDGSGLRIDPRMRNPAAAMLRNAVIIFSPVVFHFNKQVFREKSSSGTEIIFDVIPTIRRDQ
jgi:hypothetical protein